MPASTPRNPLIDILKGLACVTIVGHHLAFYGPMSDIAQPLFPDLLAWLSHYGRMAVQVFLVLGGYLAAGSLAPNGLAKFDHLGPKIGQRWARLVIPYAVALVVAVLLAALVRPWFEHASVPAEPSFSQLLAHALLLHDLLDEEALSAGVWYVAIDFQLFVLTVLLFAGVRRVAGQGALAVWLGRGLVLGGGAASLLLWNRQTEWDVWALYFWGSYSLGIAAHWAVRARRVGPWLWAIAGLSALALSVEFRERILLASLTAITLVWLLRQNWPHGWGRWTRPLEQIGQMSYSVFLLHFALCLLVNALVSSWWPQSPAINAWGMVLAFGLSLLGGRLLYLRVERRVTDAASALHWQAGMVGTGLLVTLGHYLG